MHNALLAAPRPKPYIGPMTQSEDIRFGEGEVIAPPVAHARFAIGEVVKHRMFDFRGVVFDVDPVFANSDEWYEAIPEDIRPSKDQPYYHLLAENSESSYVAYVSQQNLLHDEAGDPVDHPAIGEMFEGFAEGRYRLRPERRH